MSATKIAQKKIEKWESCGWDKGRQRREIKEIDRKSEYELGEVHKKML